MKTNLVNFSKFLLLLILFLLNAACSSTQVKTAAQPLDYAKMELAQLETTSEAFAKSRFETLQPLVEKSLAANDCERITRYAFESLQIAKYTLPNDPGASLALYDGHMAAGYCDLKEGRIGSAEAHMNAAVEVPPAPKFASEKLVSRNLSLPRELVVIGERKVVERFLTKAKALWTSQEDQAALAQWSKSLEDGAIPDFTASTRKSVPEHDVASESALRTPAANRN